MSILEAKEWMILINLIYEINSNDDLNLMREKFLSQLKLLIEFDSAEFFMMKPDSYDLTDPVYYNCKSVNDEDYMEKHEMLNHKKENIFTTKSKVYRGIDMESLDTNWESGCLKKILEANSEYYALYMTLANKNKCLGIVSFLRSKKSQDFEYDDIFILDIIKEHLALRLYQDVQKNINSLDKMTVSKCVKNYGLTKREENILRYLIDGKDNNTICNEICITNNTLKKHILNIYRKLGIKNRVQMFKMIKEKE